MPSASGAPGQPEAPAPDITYRLSADYFLYFSCHIASFAFLRFIL